MKDTELFKLNSRHVTDRGLQTEYFNSMEYLILAYNR